MTSFGSDFGPRSGVPMTVVEQSRSQIIYSEDPQSIQGTNSQVIVQAQPQSQHKETKVNPQGYNVTKLESREVLNPLVTPFQSAGPAVVREERLPATYTTKAYEVFRTDPSTLFPGSRIVSVGKVGPVTTPSGSIYDPNTNTITSAYTGQVSTVQSAHHLGPSWNRQVDYNTQSPPYFSGGGDQPTPFNKPTYPPKTATYQSSSKPVQYVNNESCFTSTPAKPTISSVTPLTHYSATPFTSNHNGM